MTSHRMRYKIGLTEYNVAIKDIDQNGNRSGIPVGTILPYASNINLPPEGFLYCEGQAISRTMYADLFSLIGTTYGIGDGSTTFNLPNLVGGEFLEASGIAGTTKNPGLPNIEGTTIASAIGWTENGTASEWNTSLSSGAIKLHSSASNQYVSESNGSGRTKYVGIDIDASKSNAIYGNSSTVQPKALTVRYIIKVFDSATQSSALIDITQYASDLSTRLQRQQIPAFNQRVELRTSQTWTAPVTGWYKFTIKGAGGGGGGGRRDSSTAKCGGGGGEGGTTFAYEKMLVGETATITIGAGGTGGAAGGSNGTDGGDSSLTVNNNTYTAGGGSKGSNLAGGIGGSGTIIGASGGSASAGSSGSYGGNGGGQGGSVFSTTTPVVGYDGGGGGGGGANASGGNGFDGGAGGNGYCFIEYFDPSL